MGGFFLFPGYRGVFDVGTEKSRSDIDRTGGFKISREKAGRFSPSPSLRPTSSHIVFGVRCTRYYILTVILIFDTC